MTEERQADARARARRLVEATPRPSESSAEVVVAEGRPARTIIDHATEREVDRIVVGDRDDSTLSTLLFGRSVAAVIDDRTDVPVTVVEDSD